MFHLFCLVVFCCLSLLSYAVQVSNVDTSHIGARRSFDVVGEGVADFTALRKYSHPTSSSSRIEREFALEKYQTGFVRLTSSYPHWRYYKIGPQLRYFKIRSRGIDAPTLAAADNSFVDIIKSSKSPQLIQLYISKKKAYRGGLNIPFLEFLGYDLLKKYNITTIKERSRSFDIALYNKLSNEAENILERYVESMVQVSGSVFADFMSFIPRAVYPFLRYTRIGLSDKKNVNIFSTNKIDLVAATNAGGVAKLRNKTLTVGEYNT